MGKEPPEGMCYSLVSFHKAEDLVATGHATSHFLFSSAASQWSITGNGGDWRKLYVSFSSLNQMVKGR